MLAQCDVGRLQQSVHLAGGAMKDFRGFRRAEAFHGREQQRCALFVGQPLQVEVGAEGRRLGMSMGGLGPRIVKGGVQGGADGERLVERDLA